MAPYKALSSLQVIRNHGSAAMLYQSVTTRSVNCTIYLEAKAIKNRLFTSLHGIQIGKKKLGHVSALLQVCSLRRAVAVLQKKDIIISLTLRLRATSGHLLPDIAGCFEQKPTCTNKNETVLSLLKTSYQNLNSRVNQKKNNLISIYLSISLFIFIYNLHLTAIHGYTTAARDYVTRNGHCLWAATLTHAIQLVQWNVDTLEIPQGFHGYRGSTNKTQPAPVQP